MTLVDSLIHALSGHVHATLVFAVLALFVWRYRDTAIGTPRRPDLPHASKPLPLIGNLIDFIKWRPRLSEHLIKLHEIHGDVFRLALPGLSFIVVSQSRWPD